MGPRAALAVAVAVALAGCAADSNHGGGGNDMSVWNTSDMAAFHCADIKIAATDPMTGATTDHAPARLTASVDVVGVSGPHWTLRHDNDAPVTPMASDSTGLRVQYDADAPGSWVFSVSFDIGPCPGTNFINLKNALGAQQFYRFRVLPPTATRAMV